MKFRGQPLPIFQRFRALTSAQRHCFAASFMGWSLDAFDFFILTFCIPAIALEFHSSVASVTKAILWTLAMRPIGAFLFGKMADRFGRRPTLMVNILCYSVLELASAFPHSLTQFIVLRAIFGIAMGGEWGVGAALAFETLPPENRGFFSGLLQEGYAFGYLLAAALYFAAFQFLGWRGMFIVGAAPALFVVYVRSKVEESPAWLKRDRATSHSAPGQLSSFQKLRGYLPTFVFAVVLMTCFNAFSHGTQDLYPTFLEKQHGFPHTTTGLVAIIYSIGAILGGVVFGNYSEQIGRKRAIILAALLAVPVTGLFAFSPSLLWLAVGAFLMQFLVQGAWGVVPAHLNELSPAAVRAIFPGFAYQLGNLLASGTSTLEAKVAQHYNGQYSIALGGTAVIVAIALATVTALGREAKGANLATLDG